MGVRVTAPHATPLTGQPVWVARLAGAASLIRYRFFLYAGLLPYLLGAAWAWRVAGTLDAATFWVGLGGIALSVVGVESFNEYFDSRMGTDRIFNPEDLPPMSHLVLVLGLAAFAGALAIGALLARWTGWPVLGFAGLGGIAAAFYVAPPIRFAYRGLGETVIALSYGPLMVAGSLYLLAGRFAGPALLASLVPGLLVMALAVANAIPDFHQDTLAGKRNLVVRLGRRRAVPLYLGLATAAQMIVAVGCATGMFPLACLAALAGAPLLAKSFDAAKQTYERPRQFIPAIRALLACYMVTTGIFTAALVLDTAWITAR
jgi:1,4-dihydroxy-2-naphthoate octaprenyltransferase